MIDQTISQKLGEKGILAGAATTGTTSISLGGHRWLRRTRNYKPAFNRTDIQLQAYGRY